MAEDPCDEQEYFEHVAPDGSTCACTDPEGNWHGVSGRECGEHRTVGSHRAWCYDCTEWCYSRDPQMHCRGCELPGLRRLLADVEALCTAPIDGECRSHVPVHEVLAILGRSSSRRR